MVRPPASPEIAFGGQTLVRGRDFERRRGSILFLDSAGQLACLACGERWRVTVRHAGFYRGRIACPRCGAGTRGVPPRP